MKILIENASKLPIRSFANKNGDESKGTHQWHIAEQAALIFKDGSKYPDKFTLTLSFSTKESDAINVKPYDVGYYNIPDEAFYVDRNNQLALDLRNIVPAKAA